MIGRKKQPENPTRTPRDQRHSTAPVFSYYSSRSASSETMRNSNRKTSEARLKPARWWVAYLPSLISLLLIAAAALFITTLSPNPKISIRTSDANTSALQDVSVYQNTVAGMLNSSLLNRSKLTMSSDKIARDLQSKFPELGEVVVTIPLLSRRPIVEIQPAQPVLVLSSSNGTYVIDDSGQAILTTNQLKSSFLDTLPMVRDETGLDMQIGSHVLPIDTVVFIRELALQFNARGERIDSFILPAVANEVHIRPSGTNYYIKSNTEADARIQAGTYFALKNTLEGEGVAVQEYIDVRVEERAFYK